MKETNLCLRFEYFHRRFEHQHGWKYTSKHDVNNEDVNCFYPVVLLSLNEPRPRSSISLWTIIDLFKIELVDLVDSWMMESSKSIVALPNWSDLEETVVTQQSKLILARRKSHQMLPRSPTCRRPMESNLSPCSVPIQRWRKNAKESERYVTIRIPVIARFWTVPFAIRQGQHVHMKPMISCVRH